jgi:hypothetical protein
MQMQSLMPMSASGQTATSHDVRAMSARCRLYAKADIRLRCTIWPGGPAVFNILRRADGDDALGDIWVARIGRVILQILIEIVDLKKDRVTVGVERAKVMFLVWVIGVTEIIERRDSLDDPVDCF